MVDDLVAKIVNIEVELIKFSRSIPFATTDNMTVVDFFDYAEILTLTLNREQESGEANLVQGAASAISKGLPEGLDTHEIPGLRNLGEGAIGDDMRRGTTGILEKLAAAGLNR